MINAPTIKDLRNEKLSKDQEIRDNTLFEQQGGRTTNLPILRLRQSDVDLLPEYSGTMPTGQYLKTWKRNEHPACVARRGPSGMSQLNHLNTLSNLGIP